MINELQPIFKEILNQIEKNDIIGYKNLLFLLNEANQTQNQEVINETLAFIYLLFQQNTINLDSEKKQGKEKVVKEHMNDKEDRKCSDNEWCGGPPPFERMPDPVDLLVLTKFSALIPKPMTTTIRKGVKERFK